MEEVNQSLVELFEAATALHDAVEKTKPIIECDRGQVGQGRLGAGIADGNEGAGLWLY
jgi:hypothetical protein